MNRIADLSNADLQALRQKVRAEYDAFRARGLKLDMTRGKPAADQLDLANAHADPSGQPRPLHRGR